MDASRFDAVSKFFAERRLSRREAMVTGGTAVAATGLAVAGFARTASAQDATPAADATVEGSGEGPTMLFIQTYQSGTISAVDGVDGRYTLSLEAGTGHTIYFSDRPDRLVGTNPTADFLEGLGFPDDNPPNAALVVETAPGETDIAVVELFNPLYDPVSQGVTYEIEVLGNWQTELEMGLSEEPTDLATFLPTFGAAQLFIDDCPDMTMTCYTSDGNTVTQHGTIANSEHNGFCYSWGWAGCYPCKPWDPEEGIYTYWRNQCNQRFPDCQGSCDLSYFCSLGAGSDCKPITQPEYGQ